MQAWKVQNQLTEASLEGQLFYCCARVKLDAVQHDKLCWLLRQDLNWEEILRLAPRHGMIPLLYRHLGSMPQAVPPPILERLKNHYEGNAQRNLFQLGELLKLLELLQHHGIDSIPFKGPTLATSLYGDLGLRQFGDLDILIRKQDVVRAKELLLSQGHRLSLRLTPAQEEAYINTQAEYNFDSGSGGNRVNVELHWGIVAGDYYPYFSPDVFWRRLKPIELSQTQVLTFAPEDLLLILCIQRTKHLWERVDWVCDIAELLRQHPDLDWGYILEWSKIQGCRRLLYLGLYLAKNLLDADVPPEIWKLIESDPKVAAIAHQVRNRMFRETVRLPLSYRRAFFHLQTRERLRDKLEYGFRLGTLPTPTEWHRQSLPDSVSFLYGLLRPVRLLQYHGLKPLKSLLKLRSARV
jgi:Uncharacterised nucleotidyltransferase